MVGKTDVHMSDIQCEFLGFIGSAAVVSFLLGCEAVSLASLFPKLQHQILVSRSKVKILIYGSLTLPHALGLLPRWIPQFEDRGYDTLLPGESYGVMVYMQL